MSAYEKCSMVKKSEELLRKCVALSAQVKRLEKFDKQKMGDPVELSIKTRKSCENLTSNGGIENSCAVPNEVVAAAATSTARKQAIREERASLVIWKRPITTLQYFFQELIIITGAWGTQILNHQHSLALFIFMMVTGTLCCHIQGPHQKHVKVIIEYIQLHLWWLGLGVLSSIGLGTGLHTFVLYLGPRVSVVALGAYECNSVNFPEPPYPDEIICPDVPDKDPMTVLKIISKVRVEAIIWGLGTAIGELPPYFVARTARLSGQDMDDEDLEELEQLQQKKGNPKEQSFMDKAKLTMKALVERVGFLGILICASIPNPLFDLAGLTCGHFLVPFWTFFGPTLIGKAIIKTHIQLLFVIIAFNENHVQKILSYTKFIPYVGQYLHDPLQDFLAMQKAKFHRKAGAPVPAKSSWISTWYDRFLIVMVSYFILSTVNSLAQNHHKRLCKRQRASTKIATD